MQDRVAIPSPAAGGEEEEVEDEEEEGEAALWLPSMCKVLHVFVLSRYTYVCMYVCMYIYIYIYI